MKTCHYITLTILLLMKKQILLLLLLISNLALFAQGDATDKVKVNFEAIKFMGIPMEGPIDEFREKLEGKGLEYLTGGSEEFLFSGIFAGHRSKIVVKLTSRKTVNLCGVVIGDGLFDGFSTWKELHAVYEEMKSLLTEKYGEPDSFYSTEEFERNNVKESEKLNELKMGRCNYVMLFPIRGKIDSDSLTVDGTVIGSVQLTLTSKGCVQITYSGFKNSEEVKKYNLEDV